MIDIADYPYPKPADEKERLEALHACRVLDRPNQRSLSHLTDLAALAFNVPVALVSLIDESTQWMKAIHGADVTTMPRSTSFCTYVLLQTDVFVVPDARDDHRFAANPLVVNAPMIRFYAGAPLYGPGEFKLGSLCLIDHLPRPGLTLRENKMLKAFAVTATEIMMEEVRRPAIAPG